MSKVRQSASRFQQFDSKFFFSSEAEIRQPDAIVFSGFFLVVVVVVVGVRLEDRRPQNFNFVDLESRIKIS
jgi:hypothetical protein